MRRDSSNFAPISSRPPHFGVPSASPGRHPVATLSPRCNRVATGLHPGGTTQTPGRHPAATLGGGVRWLRFVARDAGFGGIGLTGHWRGQTGKGRPDKPHFPTLSARRSVKFLASLKSGFSLPRFSVRSPFTPVWEGCMVSLNWIEVYGFFFSGFRHKNFPRHRFSDLSPQRIRGTWDTFSASLEMRSPRGFQGRSPPGGSRKMIRSLRR